MSIGQPTLLGPNNRPPHTYLPTYYYYYYLVVIVEGIVVVVVVVILLVEVMVLVIKFNRRSVFFGSPQKPSTALVYGWFFVKNDAVTSEIALIYPMRYDNNW